ncbi:anthranilate synthase component II [Rhabdaerophilum sp.]|uniref:anthranilate synthase component II n=1 Tax=Rhabdaerophilum sp. TaxID=2717341 RepID=UPI0038D36A31
MRIALIDNYDSFTFNVVHALGREGAKVEVFRNDAMSAEELLALGHEAIVISPGPCTPSEAGISVETIEKANGKVPLLGVCLGHQAIGQAFGGNVIRAYPVHGKVSTITHDGRGLFRGMNQGLTVTRYHSLVVERASFPACLVPTAESEDGLVMALQHRDCPTFGVQFHPESIATEGGQQIFRNFLELAREFRAHRQAA